MLFADDGEHGCELWAQARGGVLRNTEVTALSPQTPARAELLPLDPLGDAYLPAHPSGNRDPDASVLGDRTRPLVYYALDGPGVLEVSVLPGIRCMNAAGQHYQQ